MTTTAKNLLITQGNDQEQTILNVKKSLKKHL